MGLQCVLCPGAEASVTSPREQGESSSKVDQTSSRSFFFISVLHCSLISSILPVCFPPSILPFILPFVLPSSLAPLLPFYFLPTHPCLHLSNFPSYLSPHHAHLPSSLLNPSYLVPSFQSSFPFFHVSSFSSFYFFSPTFQPPSLPSFLPFPPCPSFFPSFFLHVPSLAHVLISFLPSSILPSLSSFML